MASPWLTQDVRLPRSHRAAHTWKFCIPTSIGAGECSDPLLHSRTYQLQSLNYTWPILPLLNCYSSIGASRPACKSLLSTLVLTPAPKFPNFGVQVLLQLQIFAQKLCYFLSTLHICSTHNSIKTIQISWSLKSEEFFTKLLAMKIWRGFPT